MKANLDMAGPKMDSPTSASAAREASAIAFVWENFGPGHADRCDAVAKHFEDRRRVVGIELAAESEVYKWESEARTSFTKVTLFRGASLSNVSLVKRISSTLHACIKSGARDVFFCHYEHPATFVTALILRMLGRRVFIMNDSKYDDYRRYLGREVGKSLMYLPYCGGLASGNRSSDYLRFLGVPKDKITGNYNSLSVERIRALSGSPPAPLGEPFERRHFSIIARFVEKKNLFIALEAYDLYRRDKASPRKLHLYGSGTLDHDLRRRIKEMALEELVIIEGFLQTEAICQALGKTLALILPSIEEQFGNVVIEALAMGVPVILSENCGARDHLIRTAVNGFVVEPDNATGFAFFMDMLASDKAMWTRMAASTNDFVRRGDSSHFAEAVEKVIDLTR